MKYSPKLKFRQTTMKITCQYFFITEKHSKSEFSFYSHRRLLSFAVYLTRKLGTKLYDEKKTASFIKSCVLLTKKTCTMCKGGSSNILFSP